jgi:hypothetical protein
VNSIYEGFLPCQVQRYKAHIVGKNKESKIQIYNDTNVNAIKVERYKHIYIGTYTGTDKQTNRHFSLPGHCLSSFVPVLKMKLN